MKRIERYLQTMLIAILAGLGCFVSCQKQDHAYREFVKGGEIMYIAKPDSLKAFSGNGRVKLSWLIFADPNVSKATVYWNNGADSMSIPIQRSQGIDTVECFIDNLDDGFYTFDVYGHDSQGNSSIKAETFASVYGETYINSLHNRLINQVSYVGNHLELSWYRGDEESIGAEVSYFGIDGERRSVWVANRDSLSVLENFKPNSALEYTTLYKPDSLAIDTFYAHPTSVNVEMQYVENSALDKSLFSIHSLPGDATPWPDQPGNSLANLWSGVLAGNQLAGAWYRTVNGSGIPQHFQFDTGVSATVNSFTLWQRGTVTEHAQLYANGNLRRWEVWGSSEPSADGGYDGWVKLMECESHKPSGLPTGRTAEDIAYAQAGETFFVSEEHNPVRYIRIRVLQTWGNTNYMFTGEVSLSGSYWKVK